MIKRMFTKKNAPKFYSVGISIRPKCCDTRFTFCQVHDSRGVNPLRQIRILHIPSYFQKNYKFPISAKNISLFSFNLSFFLDLRLLLPHNIILTMMHFCVMLYTYWTLLQDRLLAVRNLPK